MSCQRPLLEVPPSVKVHSETSPKTVSSQETNWMIERRKDLLQQIPSPQQLILDYGEEQAKNMYDSLKAACNGDDSLLRPLLCLLRWPGIGTRYQRFVSWWKSILEDEKFKKWISILKQQNNENSGGRLESSTSEVLREVFFEFANRLGRIKTYRALALDENAFNTILEKDCIFPTGQLQFSQQEVENVVEEHGVRKILVARLFIAHLKRMIGKDPSVSLHDDFATTSIIASGYFEGRDGAKDRKVYLFELDAPLILTCGWTLNEVSSFAPEFLGKNYEDHPAWFKFSSPSAPDGVWFDATLIRTERYTFYGVPFLKETAMKKIYVFENAEQIREATKQFVDLQNKLHEQFPNGESERRNFEGGDV